MMGGFNIYQAIGAELQKADQLAAAVPEQVGMLTGKFTHICPLPSTLK